MILSCDDSNMTGEHKTEPIALPKTNVEFFSMELEKEKLTFNTVAVGRESYFGANDGPTLQLSTSGIAHPSIIYIPQGVNGYKYWCAMTPHFGIIAQQNDGDAYENPHILCSKDGLNWVEPNGIKNPIDKAIKGPYHNYWSDTNLVYFNNTFYLYYRGCGFPKNFFGDNNLYLRATVVKQSNNGIDWSNRKLLYASNKITPGIDDASIIASPSFIEDKGKWYCYDVVYSTVKNPYPPQGNQTTAFVFRREDTVPDGTFGTYSAENICSFDSRPWGETFDPWHIEVVKYDNKFFMLINAGLIGVSNGQSLWLAYSSDGKNFKVLPNPLFKENTYKSSLLPISTNDKFNTFMLYQSDKRDGSINAYKLTLKKI